MKRVYSADNLPMSGYVKSLLEDARIDCFLKNQNLMGAMGEIPPIECWPEVWILHDDDYNAAMHIVNSAIHQDPDKHSDWRCRCGEIIDGRFRTCWSCGYEPDN